MNYYELLGVSPDATYNEIRSAYLELSKKYHPDLNSARNANYLFVQIKEAYETLSHPVLREEYNILNRIYNNNSKSKFDYESNENVSASESPNQKDNSFEKTTIGKFSVPIWMIVLIIILIPIGFTLHESSLNEQSISIVKEYLNPYTESVDPTSYGPVKWVKDDPDVQTVYGWHSKKVAEGVYFVSYEFDYEDSNPNNGKTFYSYEVEISSRIVREMQGAVREKYVDLGLVNP